MNATVEHLPAKRKSTRNGALVQAVPASDTASMLAIISKAASDPATDLAKTEKLLDLYERMCRKNAEAAFNAGFAAMQANLPVIDEKGEIRHSGKLISTYARFEDIVDAVRPVLRDNGFGISFTTRVEGNQLITTAILSHKDGHSRETSLPLAFDTSGAKNTVQATGSTQSYGMRYTLKALLGIAERGTDDDGGSVEVVSQEQAANIHALIEETKADKRKFLEYFQVNAVEDLPAKAYKNAVAALERKRK